MRATIALISFAAVALAQSSSGTDSQSQMTSAASVTYSNGFTTFLTQTDSLGVVTGQPSVVTSQPSVVTSQPTVVTSPAGAPSLSTVAPIGSGGASSGASAPTGNSSFSSSSPSATSAGASGSSGSGGSSTSSASPSATTGAAPLVQPAVGLGLAGAIFAALL